MNAFLGCCGSGLLPKASGGRSLKGILPPPPWGPFWRNGLLLNLGLDWGGSL